MKPWRDALRRWAARRALHRCDVLGDGARTDGEPYIENHGHIELGPGVVIVSSPVRTHLVTGPRGRIVVGARVSIGHGVSMCSHGEITVGEGTVIGPFAVVVDVDFHEIADRAATGEPRPIRVGRNVRIGPGVVLLRGACIEDGAVVDANSVVARRVPENVRVAGVPCRPRIERCA